MKTKYDQAGLSLIELLISITLGSFIVIGATQAYFGSRQAASFAEGLSFIQENSRFIFEEINSSVRQAGDLGCPAAAVRQANQAGAAWFKFNNVITNGGGSTGFEHFYRGIEGYTGAAAFLPGNAKVLSDVLVVHKLDSSTLATVEAVVAGVAGHDVAAAPPVFTTTATHGFGVGDVMLAVNPDCTEASMFLASARTNTTLTHAAVVAAGYYNCSVNIGSASVSQGSMSCPVAPDPAATQLQYPAQSTLAGVTTVAYFVTDTNELMRLSAGAANAEELLEGVERMVLRYGVDTNNDGVADQYRLAAGLVANDWPNVLTIRMGLIMKSNANVLDVAASVTCAGVNSPVDTELRKCIMSTINIRSRGGQ